MRQMLSGGDCWNMNDQASGARLQLNETVENTESGAILYDKSLINHISEADFLPETWASSSPVTGGLRSAGRGGTMFVGTGTSEFVLRHYRRGGLIGRVNTDRYLWFGRDRTRAFMEWRLLAKLKELGLPVPQPAAARYCRGGLWYTADLLTVREPGIRPLSDRLLMGASPALWAGIGRGIRRFHDAGACHADLNAYNVQVDAADAVFLLDFDRGRLRPPGRWCQGNLERLRRSLEKIAGLDPRIEFSSEDWRHLLEGYARGAA
jgi:3-deoxy-D-manno-octulosonic acid kinase